VEKTLDELKIDFSVAAYESITKQIQQTDLKVSLIISWDSIIAVMLGREIGEMVSGRFVNALTVPLVSLCVIFLAISGVFIFWTLKPRAKISKRPQFTGLLYTGDILRLGKSANERIEAYMRHMLAMKSTPEIYEQFVNSVVQISHIAHRKNKSFMSGLAATAISFGFLVFLIAVLSVRLGLIK
jgi:uncharacterized membrane protein